MPIAETIRGFKEIIEGKHDDVPERAFFLKGSIDQVVAEAGSESDDDESDENEENGSEKNGSDDGADENNGSDSDDSNGDKE